MGPPPIFPMEEDEEKNKSTYYAKDYKAIPPTKPKVTKPQTDNAPKRKISPTQGTGWIANKTNENTPTVSFFEIVIKGVIISPELGVSRTPGYCVAITPSIPKNTWCTLKSVQ